MNKITVSVRQLQAVSLFAPKNDTRYYLNGVAINSGHLVATNGHYLFAISVKNSDGLDTIIPIEAITDLLKLLSTKEKREREVIISIDGNVIILTSGDKQIQTNAIDGKYPDWQSIIPDIKSPRFYKHFNWSYMALFDKASKILRDSKCGAVYLISNGTGAARVEVPHDGPDVIGVLMPMRDVQ